MEHIVSHAARMRNRTRGRLTCPLVIRTPFGAGIHAPEHPLKVWKQCSPTFPVCAWWHLVTRPCVRLLSAIQDPDPVIFLEPTRIYRLIKQEVMDDGQGLPLDTCFTLQQGTDIARVMGRNGA